MSEFDFSRLSQAEKDDIRAITVRRWHGLTEKFTVIRNDGKSQPGEKHHSCHYFVLDLVHDKHAANALEAYAESCSADYPALASDLRTEARRLRQTIADRRGKKL
jgi:hypothetical protein